MVPFHDQVTSPIKTPFKVEYCKYFVTLIVIVLVFLSPKYLYNNLIPCHHFWVQPQYLQSLPIAEDDSFLLLDASAYDLSLEREP